MTALLGIFTAFGLSASAGLNAYIPLLVIALLARFTDLIVLNSPWDTLTNPWVIGLLVVLSSIEFFADKVSQDALADGINVRDALAHVGIGDLVEEFARLLDDLVNRPFRVDLLLLHAP